MSPYPYSKEEQKPREAFTAAELSLEMGGVGGTAYSHMSFAAGNHDGHGNEFGKPSRKDNDRETTAGTHLRFGTTKIGTSLVRANSPPYPGRSLMPDIAYLRPKSRLDYPYLITIDSFSRFWSGGN